MLLILWHLLWRALLLLTITQHHIHSFMTPIAHKQSRPPYSVPSTAGSNKVLALLLFGVLSSDEEEDGGCTIVRTKNSSSCSDNSPRAFEKKFSQWLDEPRDLPGLVQWARDCNISMNGVDLVPSLVDGDWNLQQLSSSSNGSNNNTLQEADRILNIPRQWILDASQIEAELSALDGWEDAKAYMERRNCYDQLPQFCLWIRLLQLYQDGSQSPWHAWIQSLPRHFTNALAMQPQTHTDDGETTSLLDYLPPYAWSLAKLQLLHLEVFPHALRLLGDGAVRDESILHNAQLHQWALSVVFTRCWGMEDEKHPTTTNSTTAKRVNATAAPCDDKNTFCHICPIGDLLNHAEPATTFLDYDDEGNCNVFMKTSNPASLSLSYSRTTNPSRFLVLYGFCDLRQGHIFSQMLVTNPTSNHVDLGYSVDEMTLDISNGTLALANWRVVLYSILEQRPKLQVSFYHAYIANDTATVAQIQDDFRLETAVVWKKHFDAKIVELEGLLAKMDQTLPTTRSSSASHYATTFFIIRQHNIFLYQCFCKARQQIHTILQEELTKRKRD